jgi:hypothetical protein
MIIFLLLLNKCFLKIFTVCFATFLAQTKELYVAILYGKALASLGSHRYIVRVKLYVDVGYRSATPTGYMIMLT